MYGFKQKQPQSLNQFALEQLTNSEKAAIGEMARFSNLQIIQLQKSSGNVYDAMNNIAKGSVNHNNQSDFAAYLNQLIANRRGGLRGNDEVTLLAENISNIFQSGVTSNGHPPRNPIYANSTDAIAGELMYQASLRPQSPEVLITPLIQNLSFTPPKAGSVSNQTSTAPLQENKIVSYEPPTLYEEEYLIGEAPPTYAAPPPTQKAQKVQTIAPPVREVAPLPPPQPVVVVKEKVPTWVWYAGGGAAALLLIVLITSKK